jgi:RNA polymerase sigma-70 factor (ECF subfamily)
MSDNADSSPGDRLLRTFEGLRDDLVGTLRSLLHNAQDVAQEAFVRCWRTLGSVPEGRNLRAWIFRVALRAAKDFQRSVRLRPRR